MSKSKHSFLTQRLVCPTCHKKKCSHISWSEVEKQGKFFFLKLDTDFKRKDWFDSLKAILKKNKKVYDFIISVLSPVYVTLNRDITRWISEFKNKSLILNIGSGPFKYPKTFSLDVFNYKEVDVIADATKLPFEDQSVDGILNIAVLEHVKNPKEIVAEFHRVLRKNGRFFVFIPFMQGFHASPYDYQRWTREGAKELFKEFSDVNVKVTEGPTSALLWVFQEWFAITFSFYSKTLYKILLIFIMLITWPLKYLDVLLQRHPFAENITAGFYVIGRK